MKVYTHYDRPATRYQVFTQPSLTIPDQTMSLKTMVTKYVKGLPISAPHNVGTYTGDEIATDFNKLDLAEQEESVLNASNELTEIKHTITKQQKEKAANDKEKAQKQEQELKELREKLALTP